MTTAFVSDPHSGARSARLEKALGFKITGATHPMLVIKGRKRPALTAEINMWLLLMAAPRGNADLGLLDTDFRGERK